MGTKIPFPVSVSQNRPRNSDNYNRNMALF